MNNKNVELLKQNHFSEWIKKRNEVEETLSNNQTMFCVCGRLATGLHEMNCKKFKNQVDRVTEKSLIYLLNN